MGYLVTSGFVTLHLSCPVHWRLPLNTLTTIRKVAFWFAIQELRDVVLASIFYTPLTDSKVCHNTLEPWGTLINKSQFD